MTNVFVITITDLAWIYLDVVQIPWTSAVSNTCKIWKDYLKYVGLHTYLESKIAFADYLYHIAYAGVVFMQIEYIYFILMTTSNVI